MRPWIALVALACAGEPETPPPTATLFVRGAPVGLTWRTTVDDTVRWRHRWRLEGHADTERSVVGTLDDAGRLAAWRLEDAHGTVTAEGRFDRDRPMWLLGGGPAVARWPVGAVEPLWFAGDGSDPEPHVVSARRTEDGAVAADAPDTRWRFTLDGDRLVALTWPDGGQLGPGPTRFAPVDPVALTAIAADVHPDPRGLRRLVGRWSTGGEVVVARPLAEELPPWPATTPTRSVDVLTEAMQATRQAVQPDPSDPARDCEAAAAHMAAGLIARGAEARPVHGWLLTAHGRLVRHAWVRTRLGDVVVDSDPALGQAIADAGRIDGEGVPTPPPLDLRLSIDAAGTRGAGRGPRDVSSP